MHLEPIWQAPIQQHVYRELLDAFSYPGQVKSLNPLIADNHALNALLATLLDGESRLADTIGHLKPAQWSLLQAQKVKVNEAQFIVACGNQFTQFYPNLGSLASPEYGATLILTVEGFYSQGHALNLQLKGPGIATTSILDVEGLSEKWLEQRTEWNQHFPLGVDIILASPDAIVALPRTTHIQLQIKEN